MKRPIPFGMSLFPKRPMELLLFGQFKFSTSRIFFIGQLFPFGDQPVADHVSDVILGEA